MSTVHFTHVDLRRGKPTLAWHAFDVALRNDADRTRWVVIPQRADAVSEGGVRGVDVFELPAGDGVPIGAPTAYLWRFEGTGGFWAIRLPATATIELHSLELKAWWDKEPAEAAFEVVFADEVLVGGEPAARWLGHEDVGAASGSFQARVEPLRLKTLHWRRNDKGESGVAEKPVELVGASRVRVKVPLSAHFPAEPIRAAADLARLVGRRVRVDGTARRAKLGTVVVGDGFSVYCGGLSDSLLGARFTVEGTLERSDEAMTSPGPEPSAGTEGSIFLLRGWRVVEPTR